MESKAQTHSHVCHEVFNSGAVRTSETHNPIIRRITFGFQIVLLKIISAEVGSERAALKALV